jgi:hypothetical protein
MRSLLTPVVVFLLALVTLADAASAVERRPPRPLLYQRTAVSGFYGAGLPAGEFADDREGDGNHEANWPPDWAVEIEHFAGRTASIGFSIANTTYQDKTFPDLETHLSTYSGFIRVVMPTATAVRPYLRFGMGGVEVQFQDEQTRVDAEYELSLQGGAGLLWMPSRWIGINAQALFYYGDTEDAYISENNTIVGFDTKYWAFAGGLSLFFP